MLDITFDELHKVIIFSLALFLDSLQIDIFQCRSVLGLFGDKHISVDDGALQVEDIQNVLGRPRNLDGIGHEQQIDRHNILHLYLEDSVDPGNETVRIGLQVSKVLREGLQKHFKFIISHGFDNEFIVVAEEEERARFTLTFTSFEDLISIPFGRERELDFLFVDLVHFSQLLKLLWSVLKDGYFLVDSKHGLVLSGIFRNCFDGAVLTRDWFLVLLNELIIDEVLLLSLIPLLRILDLDTV